MTTDHNEVITWYAFRCPKSKREYFYEPSTGAKTWALPTSKSVITNAQKKASLKHQGVSAHRPSKEIGEKNMGENANPSSKMCLIIVGALVISLLFNTIFLVVLIKISGPQLNKNFPEIIETMPNAGIKIEDAAGEKKHSGKISMLIAGDVSERAPSHSPDHAQRVYEQAADIREQTGTGSYKEHQQDQMLENNDILHSLNKQRLDVNDIKNDKVKFHKDLDRSLTVPSECWVPFAYVFNPRCRRNGDIGLPGPMFDAEQFASAVI